MTASSDRAAVELMEAVPLVMRAIRSEMRRRRNPDLSVPQFRALAFLRRHDGASMSDVADHVGVALPSMSKMMDGLVERGLVRRTVHARDRRRATLVLSPGGRTMLERARAFTRAFLARRLAHLSRRKRDEIVRAMRTLAEVFQFERPEAGR